MKYEGGHSRITVTVPAEGPERLEAVVAAAEGVRAAALSVALA
jgi:transcription-repair coupling factor (superfamily II helicase)